jgi:hypothetical protein
MQEEKKVSYGKELRNLERILNKFLWTSEKSNTNETEVEDDSALTEIKVDRDLISKQTIRDLFTKYKVMLAGGTINSIFSARKVNDLDLYLKEDDEEKTKAYALVKELEDTYKYKVVHTSPNAITLRRKGFKDAVYEIQIITRFVGEPQFILDTFDFTIVKALFDFENYEFVMDDRFLIDIAQRKLQYTGSSQYPICALYRTKKYQERGYTLSGANIVAISMAIHGLKIKTYGDLKDQLMGIDTSMFEEITKDFDDSKTFDAVSFINDWYEMMFEYYEEKY